MGTVLIDGREVEIDDSRQLNGIQAAQLAGVEIPHYCWHPGLSVVASCRMCLVETGRRDPHTGQITMLGKLVPACQTPATDGTVFVTDSEHVRAARAMVQEDLLLRHPIDCPICDKAGECRLQDYHFQYGQERRRADIKPFTSRRRPLGETVALFVDRCVLCSRCVRFCREVSQSKELMVVNRGAHEEIDVFPGFPLNNPLAGNVVDLCPVGALADRDFLYQQRVWFLSERAHVCAGCATGCSIVVEQSQDRIYRIRPRENRHVNRWWMCDEGRYGWRYVHSAERHVQPRRRTAAGWQAVEWPDVVAELEAALRGAQRPAVVCSPFLTVEETWLLATYALRTCPHVELVRGPVPVTGEDRAFAGGFTIHAEKCPNRQGVEAVLAAVTERWSIWDAFLEAVAAGREWDLVWIVGGYPDGRVPSTVVAAVAGVKTLVVQDLFSSPLSARADWFLPATAFAERGGSFVNQAGRLQTFRPAIRPPQGVLGEGPLLWRLAGREGLYNAAAVRREVAGAAVAFAVAAGDIPDVGVDLRVNQLA